ncbi:S-adenosyl-L-methionine-dependent methyltransferase [Choiromyces venosus 120613-1]|uniref:S-adenosyl-L-methionine-dependent methyltransferase n=1 Tax=Choiromyces venosus 120613-1 TaxID=1336337 RepID=A0A3N4J9N8_9PEZI|nr:S-adenosyl-L-methionine-dependent methyltransferase [Choiromyces venosus 120613-1]
MLTRMVNYLQPAYLLLFCTIFGFKALYQRLLSSSTTTNTTFREAWFALFWAYWAPPSTTADYSAVSRLLSQCRGTILDIGPGTGSTLPLFPQTPAIKHIYGLEPNRSMHAELQRSIDAAGLSGVYTILPFGAEDVEKLRAAGITEGSVDTIVTVRVLCSLEEKGLEKVLEGLYTCLKPGGEWLVLEHVRNWKSGVSAALQGFYQIFWPGMLAGCNINRRTNEILPRVGKWNVNDLVPVMEEEHWEIMPHVWGRLIKARK